MDILQLIVSSLLSTARHVESFSLITTPSLTTSNDRMAVGYYGDTIYILGGFWDSFALQEFSISSNTFTSYNSSFLSNATWGNGQFYTQQHDKLYMLNPDSEHIMLFDLATKAFDSAYAVTGTLPENDGISACLTSSESALYFIPSNGAFYYFEFDVSSWASGPSTRMAHADAACAVTAVNARLYIIGGTGSNADVVEHISTINISSNSWADHGGTLHDALSQTRVFSVDTFTGLLLIGGCCPASDSWYTIEPTWLIPKFPLLPLTIYGAATVTVEHTQTLYAFGGHNGTSAVDSWMQLALLYDI